MNQDPKKAPADSLAILIQTPTLLDNARALALAALRKGKRVHLHISGKGIQLINHPGFTDLCRQTETTVCQDCLSASGYLLDPSLDISLVRRQYQVALLQHSTRVVVL